MRKRVTMILATLAVLALTAVAVMPVTAAVAIGDPVFSAGNFSDGICSCPVDVGNCVCKYTPRN